MSVYTQSDAPEDSPAIQRLKGAYKSSCWTPAQRELMLTQVANRSAEYICTVLALELSPSYNEPSADLTLLESYMHDESSGISFRDMMAEDVRITLKGVLEHE